MRKKTLEKPTTKRGKIDKDEESLGRPVYLRGRGANKNHRAWMKKERERGSIRRKQGGQMFAKKG